MPQLPNVPDPAHTPSPSTSDAMRPQEWLSPLQWLAQGFKEQAAAESLPHSSPASEGIRGAQNFQSEAAEFFASPVAREPAAQAAQEELFPLWPHWPFPSSQGAESDQQSMQSDAIPAGSPVGPIECPSSPPLPRFQLSQTSAWSELETDQTDQSSSQESGLSRRGKASSHSRACEMREVQEPEASQGSYQLKHWQQQVQQLFNLQEMQRQVLPLELKTDEQAEAQPQQFYPAFSRRPPAQAQSPFESCEPPGGALLQTAAPSQQYTECLRAPRAQPQGNTQLQHLEGMLCNQLRELVEVQHAWPLG